MDKKTFGENAEGLFYCGNQSCGSTVAFKWHAAIARPSKRDDAKSVVSVRWEVQILSPVSALGSRCGTIARQTQEWSASTKPRITSSADETHECNHQGAVDLVDIDPHA